MENAPAVGSMTALLDLVTTFLSHLANWIGTIIGIITGNDYLLVGFVILIVSFLVGLVIRFSRTLGHNPM